MDHHRGHYAHSGCGELNGELSLSLGRVSEDERVMLDPEEAAADETQLEAAALEPTEAVCASNLATERDLEVEGELEKGGCVAVTEAAPKAELGELEDQAVVESAASFAHLRLASETSAGGIQRGSAAVSHCEIGVERYHACLWSSGQNALANMQA